MYVQETDLKHTVTEAKSESAAAGDVNGDVTGDDADVQSLDLRSILSGGNLCGWTPDVAVVMWRRLLGILGDVNAISDSLIHEQLFEHLCDIIDDVNKVRVMTFC